MDYQIQQVLTVCPHVPKESIERDLKITRSVPDTINRILDGIFLETSDERNHLPAHESVTSTRISPSPLSEEKRELGGTESFDQPSSDDELLPSISLRLSPYKSNSLVKGEGAEEPDFAGGESKRDKLPCAEEQSRISDALKTCSSDLSEADLSGNGLKGRNCSIGELSARTGVKPNKFLQSPGRLDNHSCSDDDVEEAGPSSHGNHYGSALRSVQATDSIRRETLDLTGESSSDPEVKTRVDQGIEISSSDEDEVRLSDNPKTDSKLSEVVGSNDVKEDHLEGISVSHLLTDSGRESETLQETTKGFKASVVPASNRTHTSKMIDISSSDESEDELPLWKRVQLKNNRASTISSGRTVQALSEIIPNRDNLQADVVNRTDSLEIKQFGAQESQSSTISGSSVIRGDESSKQDASQGTVPSSVTGLTASSTDLSQASDVSRGVKRKRSPEEIQMMRQQALEKKLEKEKKREEQIRVREQKKREKQKEADHRKALREAHKALRPEECMKSMTISVDQSLLEGKCGSHILQKLQELTCKVAIVPQPVEGAITWCRQSAEQNLGEDIQLDSLQKTVAETESLVIINMDAFIPLVHASLQGRHGEPIEGDTIQVHATQSVESLGGKSVTYIVQGAQQYFRNSKNRHQRNFRTAVLGEDSENNKKGKKKKKAADNLPNVTRVQLEEALVNLQLEHGCNVHFKETPEAVAEFIAMFTKAVAEKPFKQQRDKATFSFHVNSEWAGGAKVAKDGRGLIKVWKQQLQQFRNVSPEIATAIIAQYPSPQLLLKGYERCSSTKEAEMLLQDIVIRRGEGVLATSRRVGPELSRRVYKQMTSTDGTLLL